MANVSTPTTLTRFAPRSLRALEASVHRAWLRSIVSVFARDGGPLPDWDASARRVLFIRYDRVGDMVLCTGILRAIAEAHPRLSVDVLTTPANAPVLEHLPFIDQVFVHERRQRRAYPRLFKRLAARRYDAAIDGLVIRPSVNSYTTTLMLASRARWRIGSAGRPHDGVYNVPVSPRASVYAEHHVEHLARLATPFGIGARDADWRPTLCITAAERGAARVRWSATPGDGPRILVNVSAGQSCRRWPDDHFAVTLVELRARSPEARIIVVALEQDVLSAQRLSALVGGVAIVPRLRELFALVAESELVVTPDTGVTHIASAFARPTLALLRRRTEFEMWAPYDTPSVCVYGPTETVLADLEPEPVVASLDRALALCASARPGARPIRMAVEAGARR